MNTNNLPCESDASADKGSRTRLTPIQGPVLSSSISYDHQEASELLRDNPEGMEAFAQSDIPVDSFKKYPKKSNFYLKNWNRQKKISSQKSKQRFHKNVDLQFSPYPSSKPNGKKEPKNHRKIKNDVWWHSYENELADEVHELQNGGSSKQSSCWSLIGCLEDHPSVSGKHVTTK